MSERERQRESEREQQREGKRLKEPAGTVLSLTEALLQLQRGRGLKLLVYEYAE